MPDSLKPPALLASLLLFAVTLSIALPARVEAQEPSNEEEKAKVYYDKGVEAFFEKNFPQAITYFQRAHSLDPDAVVLYNISLAHSKMGNAPDALDAALEAQEMGDLPEDTALKNQFRIVAYRRAVTALEVTEALNPPVADADGATKKKRSVRTPEPDEDALGAVGWSGLGVAGLGAGALIGAGVLNFIVSGNLEEYDTARADGDYGRASGLYADIGDRQEIGRVLLYSGAGLVAVGGALFAYDFFGSQETSQSSGQASVFGAVDPDGARVQLRWSF